MTTETDRLLAQIDSLRNVLADRERELLEVKGSCRNRTCSLHYAHYGPCASSTIKGDQE